MSGMGNLPIRLAVVFYVTGLVPAAFKTITEYQSTGEQGVQSDYDFTSTTGSLLLYHLEAQNSVNTLITQEWDYSDVQLSVRFMGFSQTV